MTNLRTPVSFAAAMQRVAGVLTFRGCARLVQRSDRCVYAWSEEGSTKRPTIAQALMLDIAYRESGGEGSPFLDTFATLIGVQIERRDACRLALADAIADVARESGDALAASIAITQSNASPLSTLRASAEVGQLLAAANRLARRLVPFLPAGAGSASGNSGGAQ